MPGRLRTHTGLTVTFTRDGDEVDSQTAPTGETAVKTAILVLARLDYLQDGDRLTVTEAK
jgi:hypothetical protein